jgi:hypothetical protein
MKKSEITREAMEQNDFNDIQELQDLKANVERLQ